MGAGASLPESASAAAAALEKLPSPDSLDTVEALRQNYGQLKLAMESMAKDSAKLTARHVHILHFNDVYNLEPSHDEDPIGGVTRFCTVLKELKKDLKDQGHQFVVVFSGDFVAPSLMSTITKGAHFIDVFNELGVEFGCFGNHEFDFGYESLKRRLGGVDDDVQHGVEVAPIDYPKSTTTWLSTNITEGATGAPMGGDFAQRTALVERGGVKLGFLSVSENWLGNCCQLLPGELVYEDFVESATAAAAKLREEGAEFVFAVTHNRMPRDRALAEAVPGIDLILGGHDHDYKRDRRLRIVKGGQEWRWLSHVHVTLEGDLDGGKAISVERYDVDSEVAPDPAAVEICAKYARIRDAKYSRVLTQTAVDFDASEAMVRFQEGTLTNWCCDVIAEDYSKQEGLQQADIGLLCGYRFKSNTKFPKGSFTLGDLFSIFSEELDVVVLKLTGDEIIQTLRRGAKKLPGECGPLFHCSSRLSYKVTLRSDVHQKYNTISDVLFDGKPIELGRTYSVAMDHMTAQGKYGYDWLKPGVSERIVDEEYAITIQQIVDMYCMRHAGEEATATLGRLVIVEK